MGQLEGKGMKQSVVFEAIRVAEMWIWNYLFSSLGSLNDINMLDHSTKMGLILSSKFPLDVIFVVNGKKYCLPYFLADRNYSNWGNFMNTITDLVAEKERQFAEVQEAVKKDAEQMFGVLVARFRIMLHGCRLWCQKSMAFVIKACSIIRYMVVEAPFET